MFKGWVTLLCIHHMDEQHPIMCRCDSMLHVHSVGEELVDEFPQLGNVSLNPFGLHSDETV